MQEQHGREPVEPAAEDDAQKVCSVLEAKAEVALHTLEDLVP